MRVCKIKLSIVQSRNIVQNDICQDISKSLYVYCNFFNYNFIFSIMYY